eukprot:2974107-Pyramimonas_sp.AAC.1
MGWAWSVFFIQSAREDQLFSVRPGAPWINDKIPAPPVAPGSPANLMRIDNYAFIGDASDEPYQAVCDMKAALSECKVVSELDDIGDPGFHDLL